MTLITRRPTLPAPRHAACTLPAVLLVAIALPAAATEPCGDFGECKALIEINSSDGDIGFHFLADGEDLNELFIEDPTGARVFDYKTKGPLKDQKLTETFAESVEPPCWYNGEDFEILTLEEFLARWHAGTYSFYGKADGGERFVGETTLSHALPAAPLEPEFDGSTISWSPGTDLGQCADAGKLADLVEQGLLPALPADVPVAAWEVEMVPDVEEGDPRGGLSFSVRLPGNIAETAVTVPAEFLASLPADTPVKWEVGAVGADDNATFTEGDGVCVNRSQGCD